MDNKYRFIIGCLCTLCLTATGCSSKPAAPVSSTEGPATVLPLEGDQETTASAEEKDNWPVEQLDQETLLREIDRFTQSSPMTNREEILLVLENLQAKEEAWFSKPGWYQQVHGFDSERFGHMVFLTHVIDSNHGCNEQLFYYLKDGQIWPFIIRLEDGAMGSYNPLFDGKTSSENVQPADQAIPCDLGDGASLWVGNEPGDFILHDETLRFQSHQELAGQSGVITDMRAWVETVEGADCFVWETLVTYKNPVSSGSGVYMDPKTNTLEHIAGTTRRIYVEMDTGLMLKDEQDLHLLNGELVDGSDSQPNSYDYFEVLPAEIADVYDKMAEDVQKALEE